MLAGQHTSIRHSSTDGDTVSLHSLTKDNVEAPESEGAGSSSNYASPDSTLKIEYIANADADGHIPDGYTDLACELFSTGSYAVLSKGPLPPGFDCGNWAKAHHALYQGLEANSHSWRPLLSGRVARWALPVLLWVAIFCHLLVSWAPIASIRLYGPCAIASMYGYTANLIVTRQLRALSYDPSSINRFRNTRNNRDSLIAYRVVALGLIVPLLSIPVMPSTQLKTFKEPKFILETLPSWAEAIAQMSPSLPSLPQELSPNMFRNWGRDSTDDWDIEPGKVRRGLPPLVNFTGAFSGSTNGVDLSERGGEVVLMPVVPAQPIPLESTDTSWTVATEAIVLQLQCQLISPQNITIELEPNTGRSVTIEAYDSHSCSARVDLEGTVLDSSVRAALKSHCLHMKKGVSDLERDWKDNEFQLIHLRKYAKLLAGLSETLSLPGEILSYRPKWTTSYSTVPSHKMDRCKNRYFITSLFNPIYSTNVSTIDISQVLVSSCAFNYTTADALVRFRPPTRSKFRAQASGSVGGQQIDIGNKEVLDWVDGTTPWFRNVRQPKNLGILDPVLVDRIDKILGESISGLPLFDKRWPIVFAWHMYYSLVMPRLDTDSRWMQRPPLHAALYGTRLLASDFVQRMSSAAGLALDELRSYTSSPNSQSPAWKLGELQYSTYQPITVQSRLWFRLILYISSGILTLISVYVIINSITSPSGLPWDVSSIATKCFMFVNSRVVQITRLSSGNLPFLPGLRIGNWAGDEGHSNYSWRLDSEVNDLFSVCSKALSATSDEHASQRQPRYAWSSLPFIVRPWMSILVLTFLGAGFVTENLIMNREPGSAGINPAVVSKKRILNVIPVLFGFHGLDVHTGTRTTFGVVFFFWFFPLIISSMIVVWWWPALSQFYQRRQPWASLAQPTEASTALTLSYEDYLLPIFKAYRHRHWRICFLLLGCYVWILIPFSLSGLYNMRWRKFNLSPIPLEQVDRWNISLAHTVLGNTRWEATFDRALRSALIGIAYPNRMPFWASFNETLLPLNLYNTPDVINQTYSESQETGYWMLATETYRAELACRDASSEVFPNPCEFWDGQHFPLAKPGATREFEGVENIAGMCGQWTLLPTDRDLPEWAISLSTIDRPHSSPVGKHRHNIAVICTPRIYKGKGIAHILSNATYSIANASVHAYEPISEELVVDQLPSRVSKMLNTSMHRTTWTNGVGILARSNSTDASSLIHTRNFSGDILSFILYRYEILRRWPEMNVTLLSNSASKIFATVFSAALQVAEFEKLPSPETILVTPVQSTERITINPVIGRLLLVSALLLAISIVAVGFPPKKYRFPVNPDTLPGSLYLLAPSPLIDIFSAVPHPEKKTLEEIHNVVTNMGLEPRFGTYSVLETGDSRWTIVVGEENAGGDAYRDDVDEEDSNESREEHGESVPVDVVDITPTIEATTKLKRRVRLERELGSDDESEGARNSIEDSRSSYNEQPESSSSAQRRSLGASTAQYSDSDDEDKETTLLLGKNKGKAKQVDKTPTATQDDIHEEPDRPESRVPNGRTEYFEIADESLED